MDNKEAIIRATIELIEGNGALLDEITVRMQQMLLRCETVSKALGIDLTKKETCKAWHSQIPYDILEV